MNTNHSHVTKNTGLNVNWTICTFLIAAAFFVAGCGQNESGNKVSGIYKPVNDMSIIRALNFTSDGKVETSSTFGTETDTYIVEGNQIKITEGKDTQVFTIDKDGSLDGGTGIGRFVKEKVTENKVSENKVRGNKVSGIYKPVNDMSIIRALNFTSDGKVETSSTLGTETETFVVEGNQVKIKEGKDTQVFTIAKDGSLDGGTDIGRFVKQ